MRIVSPGQRVVRLASATHGGDGDIAGLIYSNYVPTDANKENDTGARAHATAAPRRDDTQSWEAGDLMGLP